MRLRSIQTPLWTTSFALLLLLDLTTLPWHSFPCKVTPYAGIFRSARPTFYFSDRDMGALFDLGTTYTMRSIDSSPTGMLNQSSAGTLVAIPTLSPDWGPRGFWRTTSDGLRRTLRFESPTFVAPAPLIPSDRMPDAIKTAVDAFIERGRISPDNAQSIITTGSYGDRRIIWSGVALNTLSILNASALLYSLAWIPPALNFRARRRRRRWSRLQCTACGYDLLHTPADDMHLTTCPECGTLRTPNHPD